MTNHRARNCPWPLRTVAILSSALVASVLITPVRSVTLGTYLKDCDKQLDTWFNQASNVSVIKELQYALSHEDDELVKNTYNETYLKDYGCTLNMFRQYLVEKEEKPATLINTGMAHDQRTRMAPANPDAQMNPPERSQEAKKALKKIGAGYALQIPLTYLPLQKRLELQLLKKKVYGELIYADVKPMFQNKLISELKETYYWDSEGVPHKYWDSPRFQESINRERMSQFGLWGELDGNYWQRGYNPKHGYNFELFHWNSVIGNYVEPLRCVARIRAPEPGLLEYQRKTKSGSKYQRRTESGSFRKWGVTWLFIERRNMAGKLHGRQFHINHTGATMVGNFNNGRQQHDWEFRE